MFLIDRCHLSSTLFPYTTLFRSLPGEHPVAQQVEPGRLLSGDQALAVAHELLVRDRERSEEHTSELQSRQYLVCRLLLEKTNNAAMACETDDNAREPAVLRVGVA